MPVDVDMMVDGIVAWSFETLEQINVNARAVFTSYSIEAANRAARAAPVLSGFLSNSVQPIETSGVFLDGTLQAGFGAGATYASFVDQGTKAHTIAPRYRTALRWPVGGSVRGMGTTGSGYAFAKVVHHPGTKRNPFMTGARDWVDGDIGEELQAAIAEAVDEVADRYRQ